MELVPHSLSSHLARLYAEPQQNDSLYALPRKKWYLPTSTTPDLSVSLHDRRAGNPAGPAAGPHTQMAQNLLLSYLGGGRILELKTVQINDRLQIPRPCIDLTTIGYNVEWSQELLLEQSLREYVAGMMLIEIFRHDPTFTGAALQGTPGDYIFDMSVGYDFDGIQSPQVQAFLDHMRDASTIIEELRDTIPQNYKLARNLNYPTSLSTSITLSTFHGCPADQIEHICEFLLVDKGLDVIVKMNPPMLGKDRLEHLLYDVMGYTDLTVAPHAYISGLQFDESLELVERLARVAAGNGRHFGTKFSNTLEVLNHKTFFPPENKTQYLSGQPLHVITMALTDTFRQALVARDNANGTALANLPVSFSAGIDRQNFSLAVASGVVPASVCSDLLRPGGFGRLPGYMQTLAADMTKLAVTNINDYILAFARQHGFPAGESDVTAAAIHNTTACAKLAENDPRYRAAQNRKSPNRIVSHLVIFDCISCDKCIPVCPNAANFLYPTPKTSFICQDVILHPDGSFTTIPGRLFAITKETQIANHADFCNSCGNCDTFCPEYGGPYIQKPNFFSTEHSYQSASPRDGFFIPFPTMIKGRIQGIEYSLTLDPASRLHVFTSSRIQLTFSPNTPTPLSARAAHPLPAPTQIDTWPYHTLIHLLQGILSTRHIHQLNASLVTSDDFVRE
ncbi:MAG TPA: hypothetical protein VFE58_18865 [Tepidisphaeraceae bacterium]|nr:hypothetical protein [Tepidisphaeraceae bacterium]